MNTPIQTLNAMNDLANKTYQTQRTMEHNIRVQLAEEVNLSTSRDDISHKEYWLRQALKELKTAQTFMLRAGSAYNSANLRDITDRS